MRKNNWGKLILICSLILVAVFVLAAANYDKSFDAISTSEVSFSEKMTLDFGEGNWLNIVDTGSGDKIFTMKGTGESGDELSYKASVLKSASDWQEQSFTCTDGDNTGWIAFNVGGGKEINIKFACIDNWGQDNQIKDFTIKVNQEYADFVKTTLRGETPSASTPVSNITISPSPFIKNSTAEATVSFTANEELPTGYVFRISKNAFPVGSTLEGAMATLNADKFNLTDDLGVSDSKVNKGTAVSRPLTSAALSMINSKPVGQYVMIVYTPQQGIEFTGVFFEIKEGAPVSDLQVQYIGASSETKPAQNSGSVTLINKETFKLKITNLKGEATSKLFLFKNAGCSGTAEATIGYDAFKASKVHEWSGLSWTGTSAEQQSFCVCQATAADKCAAADKGHKASITVSLQQIDSLIEAVAMLDNKVFASLSK